MALDQPSLPSNPNSVDGDGNGNGTPPSSTVNGGEDGKPTARLPRWTRQEILVLIQGKSDAESRFKPGRNGSGFGSSEPKWALVSSYCKKHGVNRGPIQCRKRWSNLAGDYKKIKEWETQVRDETESFWLMRNDLRRERKLPGYFDREVYDILDSPSVAVAAAAAAAATVLPMAVSVSEAVGDEEVHIYDSNRKVSGEDGLFSDFEKDEVLVSSKDVHVPSPVPISEKQFLPPLSRCQGEGNAQGQLLTQRHAGFCYCIWISIGLQRTAFFSSFCRSGLDWVPTMRNNPPQIQKWVLHLKGNGSGNGFQPMKKTNPCKVS
ncbi:uncharacterized protein LOC127128370 isoform X2 [Lathyrus oleraceus]|uniref:uncharacterized protein LOC127128370 isoform X2 n=1 Tax=Pisum sativum TaxID=3888 RepID=UPI0021D0201C|nr:uncharacterized protein LOC127128370 isoform X2 [Pisum sativum]